MARACRGENRAALTRRHNDAKPANCTLSSALRCSAQHRESVLEYIKLGHTGLDVSRICLGCMSYGGSNRGNHAWSLDEESSRPFIKSALESGINFFDTANRY